MRGFGILIVLFLTHLLGWAQTPSGVCDSVTPFYVVDMTGSPNGTWISPPDQRDGYCCGISTGNEKCIEFELTLDPGTAAISFDIASGAVPPGALYYQIDCGPQVQVGEPICISGIGPHTITFCKPGNNQNEYAITAIPAPDVSPDDTVGNGCSLPVGTIGIELIGITWTTVGPGLPGEYDNFLSCLADCDSTIVTPVAPYPSYIDIQICGTPVAIDCYPNPNYCDTIRITLLDPVDIILGPNPAIFCAGGTGIDLTSIVSGGVAPYNYLWYDPGGNVISTTSMAHAIIAGAHTLEIQDANYPGCPSFAETMLVTTQPMPTVEAGPVFAICPTSPTVDLNGAFTGAGGILWSADGSTFAPSATSLSASYSATNAEVSGGNFYVYATTTDNGICPAVTDSMLVQVLDTVKAAITGDTIVCFGETTTLYGSGSGGTGPYTFSWSTGATTSSVNVGAGTYTLTVTDATTHTCSGVFSFTVAENPPVDIQVPTAPFVTCDSTISVSISATGGNGNYTYEWSSGQTDSVAVVNTGTYFVTAYDNLGCSVTESVVVTATNSVLSASINPPATVCFGESANFSVVASGGYPPYSYDWSNGEVTAATAGIAGSYCVTVEDTLGCIYTACVLVQEAPPLTLYIPPVDPICFGASTQIVAQAGGGTPPYSYQWSTGSFNDTIVEGGGTYNVTVVDANANQCTIDGTITVAEAAPIQITFTSTPVSCFGGSNGTATAAVTGGFPNYFYNWSSGSVTATANGLSANQTYSLNISDSEGCLGSNSISVTEPTIVIASIVDSTAVSCFGGNNGTATVFAIGGTGPYTYSWYTSAGVSISQTGTQAAGLVAGQYYAQVTDANGCVVTSPLTTITQPTALAINIVSSPTSCFGSCDGQLESTVTGGNGGYSYVWNDALMQNTAIAQNLCAGTYSVTVTDNLGCQILGSSTISQPTAVTLSSTVVNANCFQANGEGCVTAMGGTAPYQYFWPNAFQGSCQLGLLANSYVVSVSDANGCTNQISVNIQNLPGPVAGILNAQNTSCNSVCDGSATVGIVGGSGGLFTVQWDAGASNQITPTASNLCAGLYGVQITDTNGCSSSTSILITEPNELEINVPFTNPLCLNDCNGTANVLTTGGTPNYGYQWVNTVGTTIGNNDSITNLCAGTYSILVTDEKGCVANETIILTDPPQISGLITPTDANCFGSCDGELEVSPVSGTAPYSVQWNSAANNQQTLTAFGLCAGSYSATLTDAQGCEVVLSETVNQPTQLSLAILNSQNVSCFGQCNGFIEVLASGGTAPYQIVWSNGMTGPIAQNLCVGNYCATVTDVNGCSTQVCLNITQPSALSINANSTNVTCNGLCNGEAVVILSGGTGPYSYAWSNGGTTSYINSLCAGIYSVVVTDNNGCLKNGVVSITQPNAITIDLVSSLDANCNQANGEICVDVSGGAGGFTMQWLDPDLQTSQCASNLLAGCYDFEAIDGNGCSMDTTFCIDNIAGPVISLNQIDNVSCFGNNDGTIITSVSGTAMPLSISWTDGSGTVMTNFNNQQIINGITADCYGIQVIDGAGCSASEVYCVNQPQPITTIISQVSHNSCFESCDGEASILASGGTPPYLFSWSQGSAVNSSSNSGLCAGTINVVVTDNQGCVANNDVVINQPFELNLSSFTQTDIECAQECSGSIQANITGGTQPYSYSWSGGFNSGAVTTNLCAGNYSLVIIDYRGCDTIFNWTISEPAPLSASISSTNSTCGLCNASASIVPSGGVTPYDFQWSTGNITPTVSASLCEGQHFITLTDANGCQIQESIDVINEASPVIDSIVFDEPDCFGSPTGSGTVFASGGATFGAYNYAWSPSTGNQVSQTAIAIPAGMHCVTVSDVNNCPASICSPMLQPSPVIAIPDGDTTICYGQEAIIWGSASGGTMPYTVNWLSVPPLNGIGPHYVSPELTQQYCFNVSDANGCVSSDECVLISVKPKLEMTTSQGVNICEGEEANLWVSVEGGNVGNYVVTWYEDFLYGPLVTNTTFANDTSYADFIPSDSSWYYIRLEDGCSEAIYDSIFVGVVIPDAITVVVPESFGCAPLEIQVEVISSDAAVFNYDFDCDGEFDLNSVNNVENFIYETEGVYDICVTTINAFGCISSATQLNAVTVWPKPTAFFSSSAVSVSIFDPTIVFDDQSNGNTINEWYFSHDDTISGPYNGLIDTQQSEFNSGNYDDVTHKFPAVGVYDVSLIVSNIYGCKDTMIRTVYVNEEYSLYVPNTITPDDDNLNDIFYVYGTGIIVEDYLLQIFDRWGLLLFETNDPLQGWDGRYKGRLVQQDAYVWKLHAFNEKGEEYDMIGHVNVIH